MGKRRSWWWGAVDIVPVLVQVAATPATNAGGWREWRTWLRGDHTGSQPFVVQEAAVAATAAGTCTAVGPCGTSEWVPEDSRGVCGEVKGERGWG